MPTGIRRTSLRVKIIAWSFVPTAIILAAVALVGFVSYQQVAEDLTLGNSRELARLSAGQLSGELTSYGSLLTTVARTANIADSDPAQQRKGLKLAGNRLAIFDAGALILDNFGTVVATEPARPDLLGQDWSSQPFYRDMARSPDTLFAQAAVPPDGTGRVIIIAVPVTGEQGELVGVLTGMFRMDPSSVSPFYGNIIQLRIGAGGTAYLVDPNGIVLFHTDSTRIGTDFSSQSAVPLAVGGKSGALRTRDFQGRDIVASYAPVPGTTWGLVIEQDWSQLLASGQYYGGFLLLLIGLGLAVPAIVVTIGVRRITGPIDKLIAAAQVVAGGKYGEQITVRTGDELEKLVEQFNRMSARLAESYTALQQREERFALITERANDGIWDWNLRTQETYFSPRWKSMLGYTDDELPNRFETWRELIHPDDLDHALAEVQAHIGEQTSVYHLEHRLRHKDGSYCWILARGIALRDDDGRPYRMVGSHTDITERKQAEVAMRQSEKRFAQIFHASPIAITVTRLGDGRYLDVNDAWLRLFGYERQAVIGHTSLDLGIWVDPRQRSSLIEQMETTGSVHNFEHLARTKTGQVREVLVSGEVMELNDERLNLSLVVDITEQKHAERALALANQTLEQRVQERTHELATLNAIAAVVSRSLDLNEIMRDALDETMQALDIELGIAYRLETAGEDGQPPTEEPAHLRAMAFRGVAADSARQLDRTPLRGSMIERAAVTGQPVIWRVDELAHAVRRQALSAEGVRQGISVPLVVKGKLAGAIVLAVRDERTVSPEELALLAAIGQQVGMAVENARLYDQAEQSAAVAERTRLARELHDSVTQSLYSVNLYAEAAARLLSAGSYAEAGAHLRELRDTAQEALREMRLLIYELRPLVLAKTGLAAALQARLDAVETRGGLRAELQATGVEALPTSIQTELYHIAQEALNNVLKHARAQRVAVQLEFRPDRVSLVVRDDGTGFTPSVASTGGGLGLKGMYERAQKIGGALEIESAPDQGTTVRIAVPLAESKLEGATGVAGC